MEDPSIEDLMRRVRLAIPELLRLNGQGPCDTLVFSIERREKLSA